MNVITKTLARLRRVTGKQLIVATVFTLAVAGAAALGHGLQQKTTAAVVRDCKANSIDRVNMNGGCGAADASEFIADANANNPGDLQAIYANFGLVPAEYSKFVASARPGVTHKDGTVWVDGRKVADNVWSLGRNRNTHYAQKEYHLGGGTLYASRNQDVFLGDSLPVMVLFDDRGVMKFAVMNDCGNPITEFNPQTPTYTCNDLQKTPTGELNTYSFTTDASAGNGAVIDHVVYDFGDGSPTVSKTNPGEAVAHKYTQPGNWSAKVTVYVKVPGGATQIIAPAGNCVKSVKVEAPFYACNYLQVAVVDKDKFQYKFMLKANAGNGATLKSVDFDFGDGNTRNGVKPGTGDDALKVVTDYQYDKAGTYTVTPTLHFATPFGEKTIVGAGTCATKVMPTLPPQPCQPGGTPAPGSPECSPKPCTPGGTPAPGSPECTPPVTPPSTPSPTLPNTGAGNVIGLFGGTSVLAAAAHFLIQKRRLARETVSL